MMFRETTAPHSEDHTKHTIADSFQNTQFPTLEQVEYGVTSVQLLCF
jgi:hypothetical protein